MIFGTFRIDAAKVRCPLLVVGGREDRIVSASVTRGIADRYHAKAKIYEAHCHWLMEEPGLATDRCGRRRLARANDGGCGCASIVV